MNMFCAGSRHLFLSTTAACFGLNSDDLKIVEELMHNGLFALFNLDISNLLKLT